MQIVIVISQLLCGGSERVVYHLYNELIKRDIKVSLIIMSEIDWNAFPKLNSNDIFTPDRMKRGKFKGNIARIKFIRKTISQLKPDIVVSFIDVTNILTLIANFRLGVPVIISERNNPEKSKMSLPWYYLRRLVYPFSQAIVVPNKGLAKICRKYSKKICVIANPVDYLYKKCVIERKKRIIAVGSLTYQKRFDLLIDAIYNLKENNRLNDYTVSIFGKGPLSSVLEKQITRLNLTDVIKLHGISYNICDEYLQSKIFILCSDYEGQPNVLLEAMSAGLACIATDCNFGPSELINNQVNGILTPVGDIHKLADAIDKFINDESLCLEIGESAVEYVGTYFSYEIIISKWIELFYYLKKNDYNNTSLKKLFT